MMDKKRVEKRFNFSSPDKYNSLSKWIFWIGLIVAVVAGALNYLTAIVMSFVVVFGIVVGLLRVKDDNDFLIGGLAFIFLISFAKDVYVIKILGNIVEGVSALISPAVIVVALKKIFRALK